jgi:hypothetical protein
MPLQCSSSLVSACTWVYFFRAGTRDVIACTLLKAEAQNPYNYQPIIENASNASWSAVASHHQHFVIFCILLCAMISHVFNVYGSYE